MPEQGTGRTHWSVMDVLYCDECGHSNWGDEHELVCPRCEGLGLANIDAIRAYDAIIAQAYK